MSVANSIILYISVMLLSGILLTISKIKKDNIYWRYGFLVLGLFPIFFIMAFRYDVGTDYFYGYIPGFKNIALGATSFGKEPGFYLLNKLIQVFTLQSQWLIITTSFIYVLCLGMIIDEQSVNPFVSIFVLFASTIFFVSLNNIRQQIAVIFILWGFRFVIKHNFWAYFGLCAASAYFFHMSSIMMILVYPLVNSKILKKYYFIWMPLGFFAIPLLVKLYMKIMVLLGYGGYLESFIGTTGNFRLLYQNIIVFVILFIGIGFKNIRDDDKNYGYFAMQYAALTISIVTYFLKLIEINERVCFYFMVFQIVSLPIALNSMYKQNKYVLAVMIAVLLWLSFDSFYYSIYINGYHEVLPYQFCFGHWDELLVKLPEKAVVL